MKTTSFELSKKLAELGFITSHCGVFYTPTADNNYEEVNYRAYHLEAILEALSVFKNKEANFVLKKPTVTGIVIDYYPNEKLPNIGIGEYFRVFQNKDETLADTAARLLILLIEKGVVKL